MFKGKKILPVVILALVVLSSSFGRAQQTLTTENITRELPHVLAEASSHVKVVPRDTTVFHWTKPPSLLYSRAAFGAEDRQILEYLANYTARYWNPAVGEGLYFAQDPLSSSYAGTALLVAVIKANTRFIDTDREATFSPEAVHELEKYGCGDSSYDSLFTTAGCFEIKKALFAYYNIKFVTYSYQWRTLPRYCKPKLGNVALIVFDASAFVTSASAVFDPRYTMPSAFVEMAKELLNFSDQKNFDDDVDISNSDRLGPILKLPNATRDSNFQSWATKSLFDCAW